MNLIQSINIISLAFVLFCSLSMTSVSGRKAQWILVDGKNYDFNPGELSQADAKASCIRNGGMLFEPRDKKTNREVFVKAGEVLGGLGAGAAGGRELWIGISDKATENEFTFEFDQTPVNFVCDGSFGGRSGCWNADPSLALTPTSDCVTGSSANDGKWTIQECDITVLAASIFGSICEQAKQPLTTTQPPETTTSDSTCLKSGITVMIGMLFFCHP